MFKIVLGTNQFSVWCCVELWARKQVISSGFQAFPLTEAPIPAILPLVAPLSVAHSHRR